MSEMNEEDFTEMGFMVELTDAEVHALLYAVKEAIRVWPGGDPDQQEQLENIKDSLFRMTLEIQFGPEA